MREVYISVLIIWNLIVFMLYGIDKYKAIKDGWRISERTLLSAAFLMGAFGAVLGMEAFRHKTRKRKFRSLVPIALALNIAVLAYFK